jgi:hypothetical protein
MNCSPTITAEEFETIHNALWELDNVTRQLEDILKPELYIKLAKAAGAIRKGLDGAYQQDADSFDQRWQHYDTVKSQLGLFSTWSMYEVGDLDQPHPFKDAAYVVHDQHWGGGGEVVKAISGPTWAALYAAADAAIQASGDNHHGFIEDFLPITDKPGHIRMITGS